MEVCRGQGQGSQAAGQDSEGWEEGVPPDGGRKMRRKGGIWHLGQTRERNLYQVAAKK